MDYKNDFNSDDDFDNSNGYSESFGSSSTPHSDMGRSGSSGGMSKAELRKTNKPIMEKRRRARINHCLNELKTLILEAMKKDPARHTKLEKADILEMTVKHLQSVQRQQLNMAIQADPSVIHKFKTGFVECAEEVNRFIGRLEGVDDSVRQRLTNHLNNCATSLEQIGSMSNFNSGYRSQLASATAALFAGAAAGMQSVATPTALFPPLPQDLNNNNSNACPPIQMGGVQLIPSRLPSGEFALIMPNSGAASTVPMAAATAPANNNNNNAINSSTHGAPFLANPTFAVWPPPPPPPPPQSQQPVINLSTQVGGNAKSSLALNEFAVDFQRISAFTKPHSQQPTAAKQAAAVSNTSSNGNSHSNTNSTRTGSSTNTNASGTNHLSNNDAKSNGNSGGGSKAQTILNSTATASPPPSPISSSASVSSHGDDSSIMHTSSDFATSRPATPPMDSSTSGVQQHSFSGVFSTPPSSAESSLSVSMTLPSQSLAQPPPTHLQQQQVTSTSGLEERRAGSHPAKRSLSEMADSSDSSDEPTAKKFASIEEDTCKGGSVDCVSEERDSMWRPW